MPPTYHPSVWGTLAVQSEILLARDMHISGLCFQWAQDQHAHIFLWQDKSCSTGPPEVYEQFGFYCTLVHLLGMLQSSELAGGLAATCFNVPCVTLQPDTLGLQYSVQK